jgi:glutaredoxin
MLQGIVGGKLAGLTEKLRVIVHRGLQETGNEGPVLKRVREVANTVNDLLGKPIHGADDAGETVTSAAPAPAAAPLQMQAPVVVYFDGKDHRTKTKIEELLRGRDIVFTVLDVANDEAERSWVVTAAKSEEFPIVVIAGTPVGGLQELTQLDVQGELKRIVFALQ